MGTWVGEAVEHDPQKKNGKCGEAERMRAKNPLFFAPVLGHLDLHAGFMMRIATMVLTRRPRRRRRETHADMPDTGRLFSGRDSSFPESDSTQFPAHAVHPTPLERHAAMFPAGFFRSLWAMQCHRALRADNAAKTHQSEKYRKAHARRALVAARGRR